jgi:hypothetical protein
MIEWSAYHYLHELRESREIETLEHKKSIKTEHPWRQKLRAGLWGCNFSRRRRVARSYRALLPLGNQSPLMPWCSSQMWCVGGGAGRGGEQEACHRSNPAHGDHTPKSRRRRPRTAARPPGPPTSRRRQQHAREKESKWQQAVGRVVTNRWVNRSGVGAGAGGSVVLLGPD